MDENIQKFLDSIKVGAKQSHRNMTLYCLLAADEAGANFLTLDQALSRSALTITETSEAGCVPELKVVNKSRRKVLMLEGEELVGARQNRVLNVTVLIAPNSETTIPVSCVEQGRWSYRSREFRSESRSMSAAMKKRMNQSVTANMKRHGSYLSNQALVWEEIASKYERMATPRSDTGAMADLFEAHREAGDQYLKAFGPVDHQVGIIVFIDNVPAGLEIIPKFDVFAQLHKKLVRSYIMDALETELSGEDRRSHPSRAAVDRILTETKQSLIERRASVALGQDIRLESDKIAATGLEFEGQVLQLSVFVKE